MCIHQNLEGRRTLNLSAEAVVRLILEFGTFVIALIGLCHKLFNKHDKNSRPHFDPGTTIFCHLRITVLYGST